MYTQQRKETWKQTILPNVFISIIEESHNVARNLWFFTLFVLIKTKHVSWRVTNTYKKFNTIREIFFTSLRWWNVTSIACVLISLQIRMSLLCSDALSFLNVLVTFQEMSVHRHKLSSFYLYFHNIHTSVFPFPFGLLIVKIRSSLYPS